MKISLERARAILCISAFSLVVIGSAYADRTIVDLDLELINVATAGDKPSKSIGEGTAFSIGQVQISTAEIQNSDPKFPDRDAQSKYNQIKEETSIGRSVIINYKLTNYGFNSDSRVGCSCGDVECFCYKLFDIVWFRDRMEYSFKSSEGKWERSSYVPQTFFFDQPSPATVVGIGDFEVNLPGISLDRDPKFSVNNLQDFYRSESFKIAVIRYAIQKPLVILTKNASLMDRISGDVKYQVLGRANFGDTAIGTIWGPFWYPFDRYRLMFLYKAYYDQALNLKLVISDELESPQNYLRFNLKKNDVKEIDFILAREKNVKDNVLPIVAAMMPLLALIFEKPKSKMVLMGVST